MAEVNILIVEDESIIAMDIKDTVVRLGYQVSAVVATGRQAIFKAGECKPDLILMDIRLRGDMDGVTAAEEIKKKYGIPVVFLTAYADSDTLQRAKITDPYGYLTKPFEERELHTTVEMALYRHEMESRLRESERYLEATLTSIGEAVIATDNGAHIRFVNPAAERLMEVTAESCLGSKLDDLFVIHDRKEDSICVDLLEMVLRDGQTYISSDNTVVIDKQGREIPISGIITPIHDERGIRNGVVAVFYDISDQRKAQQHLRDSEDRFRKLFDYAPDAYYLMDIEGRFVDGNAAAERLIGYDKEELVGKSFYETKLLSDEDKKRARATQARSESGEISDPIELTLHRKNGSQVSVEIRTVPINLDREIMNLGIARDITEHKRSEAALRESKERLRQVIDLVPHMIYARDRKGRYLLANKTIAQVFGVTTHDMIGNDAADLTNAESDSPRYLEDDREVIDSGSPIFIPEEKFVFPDGSVHYLQTSKIPITFAGNTERAVLGISVDITDAQKSESALRESEEKLRTIIANMLDVFYSCTAEGIITYVSSQVSCFGYNPDEMIGQQARDFIHPVDRESFNNDLEKAFDSGWKSPIEFRFLGKNGTVYYVEERGKIIRERGEIVGVTGILRDITEKHRSEEALRQSEEKYRSIFQNFLDVYYEADMNGIMRTVSPSVEVVLGYKAKDIIGNPVTDFYVNPEDRFNLLRVLDDRGSVNDFEILIKHQNGNPIPVSANTKIVRDEQGQPLMIQGAFRDITERKRSEEQLRSHLVAMETVSEGMALLDENEKYTYLNQAHASIYGYESPLELLGKTWHVLYDKVALRHFESEIMPEFKRVGSWTGEAIGKRKDGSLFPQEISLAAFDGGMSCVVRDITERKQTEEQRCKLQEQLKKAERMESLGVLAGGVAHDLNNMLGPLVGYPELILRKLPEDSPVRKHIGRIGRAAKDAADVIQDLLTLARRGRYEMAPLDINDMIRGYLDSPSFINLMESRPDITLEQRLYDAPGAISGSVPHLSKVIMNLIVNAFDAMPDGGTLSIITEQKHLQACPVECNHFDPGPHIAVRIRDTGMGIAPEDLSRIFEPYYSSKKMGKSGSGLGLSVVYGIVKDHGGMYDIQSVVGEGTEFILYFPICGEIIEKQALPVDIDHGEGSVLVVDDVAEQRAIAVDLLSSLGYQVNAVGSGREAVDYVTDNPVDLLVVDMILEKDFDGLDTFREILARYPDQKAVVVSGFSMTDRVKEMQKLCSGAYVRKPFTRDMLGNAVRDALHVATPVKAI